MIDTTSQSVNELCEAYAAITYKDSSGASYTPTRVDWSLWNDTTGARVQDWTIIATPAASNTVTIPGALNALAPTHPNEARIVLFRIWLAGTVVRYDAQGYTVVSIPGVP